MAKGGLCCCCLELTSPKTLWSPYTWMGTTEVYGEMLKECFDLTFPKQENDGRGQICEVCIVRLRNAVKFKEQVVSCQAKLYSQSDTEMDCTPKKEEENSNDGVDAEMPTFCEVPAMFEREPTVKIEISKKPAKAVGETVSREDVLKEIEKLKRDRNVKILSPAPKIKSRLPRSVGVKPVSKLVNKQSASKSIKNRPIKTSKQKKFIKAKNSKVKDGAEDFEAINKLSTSKSIESSKIKTSKRKEIINANDSKVKGGEEDSEASVTSSNEDLEKDKMELSNAEEKSKIRRGNACLLLENSTLFPFKANRGMFSCFYCIAKCYVNIDELKLHMEELHENETSNTIRRAMIHSRDDRVKVEVSEIGCKICTKEFDHIDDLVKHLSDEHLVKFNYDAKPSESIVCYILKDGQFKCYECKQVFLYFKTLCHHLNEHSTENVCDICGKCFVLASRLFYHRKIHSKTPVTCDICHKIISCKESLLAHMRYVHEKPKFKCTACNEAFGTLKSRLNHYMEAHGRTRPEIKCHICGIEYTRFATLNRHIKEVHFNMPQGKNFVCAYCGKCFEKSPQLNNHLLVHTKERNFECQVCFKVYRRKKTLKEHMKIHNNDKRWSCAECSQDFVQKSSLINHIRVRHADLDAEELIVYTEPEN